MQHAELPLERWLKHILDEYADHILGFDAETAQVWAKLRVPRPENAWTQKLQPPHSFTI